MHLSPEPWKIFQGACEEDFIKSPGVQDTALQASSQGDRTRTHMEMRDQKVEPRT